MSLSPTKKSFGRFWTLLNNANARGHIANIDDVRRGTGYVRRGTGYEGRDAQMPVVSMLSHGWASPVSPALPLAAMCKFSNDRHCIVVFFKCYKKGRDREGHYTITQ